MKTTRALMPRARQDELVVEELPDETLVYDLKRHKAHCLNRTSALVWQHCDGRTTVAEVAALLEGQLATPTDEAVVWMALDRLGRAHLLSEPVTLPADRAEYSRREVVRTLGRAAGISLLPVVASILAPRAAAAASCISATACITPSPPCSGLPICGQPGQCCVQLGSKCRVRVC
ncbi:MAG: PqqD family protein [Gemmatimonadetes bacterium]|nr:PqqD family protein [Gemmatimonadota bacterium]